MNNESMNNEQLPLDCFRCSWNRRKALFTAAVRSGCNKLAFGHNADDATATTLLNLLFNGRVETMAPRVEFLDSTVTIIINVWRAARRAMGF
jgi:tRNA(Ile)-lysidine synthase TilS/MesJ